MSKCKACITAVLGVWLMVGCASSKKKKPAHFRFVSMIQHPSVVLTINGLKKNEATQKTFSLRCGQSIDYQKLEPGHYQITLKAKGKKLLDKTYVMGKNGYYTLTAMGLLPEKWTVNPHTNLYQIKYLFAGEEIKSANQYLPQAIILRDNYRGSKSSGYLRVVNANPHTPKITLKKDRQSLLSGLAYPLSSDMMKLKPGRHHLSIYYGKVRLVRKKITVKPGYIYTAVVGRKSKAGDALTIHMLKNPSRTLLNSK